MVTIDQRRGQRPQINWATLNKDYFITYHARERYLTRFLKKSKYEYLIEHGKSKGGIRMVSLVYDLVSDMKVMKDELEKGILDRLDRSEERKSFLNNSEFMSMIHRKYGTQRFSFMVDEDILLVVVPHRISGQKTVVTVMYTKQSKVVSARKTFKKG
jgi:hypothetical protein